MRWLLVAALCALGGCVSTEMKTLVGSPIQEAEIRYGAPANVIEMTDGSRAYQFRSGGGAVMISGQATTTVRGTATGAVATTTATPSAILNSEGCLLTFIARSRGGVWMIEDIRTPRGLVC